jgi:hypothetical protein
MLIELGFIVTEREARLAASARRVLPLRFRQQAIVLSGDPGQPGVYCLASSQLTLITGRLSRPQDMSGPFGHAPAATQASHSANVTSVLPTAKGLAIATSCCGRSVLD